MNKEKIKECFNSGSLLSVILTMIGVTILVSVVMGLSFSIFSYTQSGSRANLITTGTIEMSYLEDTNGIDIINAMPMTDEDGKKISATDKNVFDFTVNSVIDGDTTIGYEISAMKEEGCTLTDSEVKLYLEKLNDKSEYIEEMAPKLYTPIEEVSSYGSPIGSMILAHSSNKKNNTEKYRLRMWLDQDAKIDGISRNYKVKVNVYAKGL